MIKKLFQAGWRSFTEIYGTEDDESKGRVVSLATVLLQAFFGVFISGIFYTGFLTMYGMSITDTGIITVIPYISNLCGIFSGKVLAKFKSPKKAILLAKLFFYVLYIPGITIMPTLVTDQKMRLVWFVILMLVSHVVYAPFGPGLTAWFYSFYPQDNERRARFLMFQNTFSSIMSSIILLGSGFLTDALQDSPYQNTLILVFRYFAFALVLVDTLVQSKARDFKAVSDTGLKLIHMITLPFQHKKFIRCVAFMTVWNFLGGMFGLWSYHILNHIGLSYTMINTMTVGYTVSLILFSGFWQKVLRRFSWVKTFGMTAMMFLPTEIMMFVMMPSTKWLYVVALTIQNFLSVGLNLSYGNILYINMPNDNTATYISFNSIANNFSALLGLLFATAISGISGDSTMYFMGMEMYSVQLVILIRGIGIFLVGGFLFLNWKAFTKDADIAAIEQTQYILKRYRHQRRWFDC